MDGHLTLPSLIISFVASALHRPTPEIVEQERTVSSFTLPFRPRTPSPASAAAHFYSLRKCVERRELRIEHQAENNYKKELIWIAMKRERAQSRTEVGDGRAATNSVAAASLAEMNVLSRLCSTSPQTAQTKKKQRRNSTYPSVPNSIPAAESTKDASTMDVDTNAPESTSVLSGDVEMKEKVMVDEDWTKVGKRKAKKMKKIEQRAEVSFLFLTCLAHSHFPSTKPTGTASSTALRTIRNLSQTKWCGNQCVFSRLQR